MMKTLNEFVASHTDRGECDCGKCFDRSDRPDPSGHVADMVFFRVGATGSPTLVEFLELTRSHDGAFGPCDPLDGAEHSYMELGGWLGSQDAALRYMALGSLLGAFRLLTPYTVLGRDLPAELAMQAAGMGMVTIQTTRPEDN